MLAFFQSSWTCPESRDCWIGGGSELCQQQSLSTVSLVPYLGLWPFWHSTFGAVFWPHWQRAWCLPLVGMGWRPHWACCHDLRPWKHYNTDCSRSVPCLCWMSLIYHSSLWEGGPLPDHASWPYLIFTVSLMAYHCHHQKVNLYSGHVPGGFLFWHQIGFSCMTASADHVCDGVALFVARTSRWRIVGPVYGIDTSRIHKPYQLRIYYSSIYQNWLAHTGLTHLTLPWGWVIPLLKMTQQSSPCGQLVLQFENWIDLRDVNGKRSDYNQVNFNDCLEIWKFSYSFFLI